VNARLAVVPELEAELDRLYAVPLDEFIASRNELAARLRKAGQPDTAEAVRALRKPTVPVWAVNQLARRHREEVEALVAAGEDLRRAQEQAFRGEGATAVREATAAERAAVRALTQLAEQLLATEGRAVTPHTLERIAATLRAAAVQPDAAALLVAGRLPEEMESSGFAALASLAPPPPRRRTKAADDDEVDRRARREHEQRLQALRKGAAQLARKADQAEAKAERAERGAAEARAAAEAARAEAQAAAAELDAAEDASPA
jgi:hypothetical protein